MKNKYYLLLAFGILIICGIVAYITETKSTATWTVYVEYEGLNDTFRDGYIQSEFMNLQTDWVTVELKHIPIIDSWENDSREDWNFLWTAPENDFVFRDKDNWRYRLKRLFDY